MSLAIVYSRALSGIYAKLVTIEVHIQNGMPGLALVGLPEAAVKESRHRVQSAFLSSDFEFPTRKITVNLAPADLPKEGGRYDLAIALGILAASKQIPKEALKHFEASAELALSGELRPVGGILPVVYAAKNAARAVFLSKENATEASLVKQAEIYPAKQLKEVVAHLQGIKTIARYQGLALKKNKEPLDIAEVHGQKMAKRALEIAAAGGHSLLFKGPPGSGKTMLASRLPGILPELNDEQAMQVAMLYSITHQGFDTSQWAIRPFRSPHHTASGPALVGGGNPPKPGEISLAHHGVLFLDELPEYNRHVLESIREPLESGTVMVSRSQYQYEFLARFQLIAAMNPCPCGYYNDPSGRCHCTKEQVQRYQNRLSGPLLDRIDLHVDVQSIMHRELFSQQKPEDITSAKLRPRVAKAQQRQYQRNQTLNAQLSNQQLAKVCQIDDPTQSLLLKAMEKFHLSTRYYHRLLKVARTIADLANKTSIKKEHVLEALSYSR